MDDDPFAINATPVILTQKNILALKNSYARPVVKCPHYQLKTIMLYVTTIKPLR